MQQFWSSPPEGLSKRCQLYLLQGVKQVFDLCLEEILKLPNHSSLESLIYWAPHFYLVYIISLQSDEPTVCPLVTIGPAKSQHNAFPIWLLDRERKEIFSHHLILILRQ